MPLSLDNDLNLMGLKFQMVKNTELKINGWNLVICRITESENSWSWKEPLEVQYPAQVRSVTAGCPESFWISPRMDIPQPPQATCASTNLIQIQLL